MWRLYKFLSNVFPAFFAAGIITINQSSSYFISTPFSPKNVWAEFDVPNGIGICGGEGDGFDFRSVPNGIVIIANINSETRTVKWVASR